MCNSDYSPSGCLDMPLPHATTACYCCHYHSHQKRYRHHSPATIIITTVNRDHRHHDITNSSSSLHGSHHSHAPPPRPLLRASRIPWLHIPSALRVRKWELSWWKGENLKHKYGFATNEGVMLAIAVVMPVAYTIQVRFFFVFQFEHYQTQIIFFH